MHKEYIKEILSDINCIHFKLKTANDNDYFINDCVIIIKGETFLYSQTFPARKSIINKQLSNTMKKNLNINEYNLKIIAYQTELQHNEKIDFLRRIIYQIENLDRGFEYWCDTMGFIHKNGRAEDIYNRLLILKNKIEKIFCEEEINVIKKYVRKLDVQK